VLGAVVGILARPIPNSPDIPYGPFLALGMLPVMLWGPEILRAYLDRFQQQ
jgi:prepilin signal peptidase PulO-like enzyme (type II secretory pathway)